jgi:hypothetical protein
VSELAARLGLPVEHVEAVEAGLVHPRLATWRRSRARLASRLVTWPDAQTNSKAAADDADRAALGLAEDRGARSAVPRDCGRADARRARHAAPDLLRRHGRPDPATGERRTRLVPKAPRSAECDGDPHAGHPQRGGRCMGPTRRRH